VKFCCAEPDRVFNRGVNRKSKCPHYALRHFSFEFKSFSFELSLEVKGKPIKDLIPKDSETKDLTRNKAGGILHGNKEYTSGGDQIV
jgi:hypothetical protein